MASTGFITPGGLNLSLNIWDHKPGDMIRCHNVTNDLFGAKRKRPGYTTYLTAVDNAQVTTLFNFTKDNGTQMWNYRCSGGSVYYSTQGTGAWTICGNGTLTSGALVGNTSFDGTCMIIGDGTATTRHTTDGTSFTNTSGAPVASDFEDYQNRIYAIGTASDMFFSNVGSPTSWTGGDSSSIHIPGPGKLLTLMKVSDRITTVKNSGIMHRWDGYNLFDLSTKLGPTSAADISEVEGFKFYGNRLGKFGFDGNKPEIISNPVEKYIYNYSGSAIAGTTFDNMMSEVYRYEYITSVGTVTDDVTAETIPNALLVYDYQTSDWATWGFANRPTAFLTYKNVVNGSQQLIFGDSSGQCYTYGGTVLNDNGQPITVTMEGVLHLNTVHEKMWNVIHFVFVPGMEGAVYVATSDTATKQNKKWVKGGQAVNGVVEIKLQGLRSPLLYWKITESSTNNAMHWLGMELDYDIYHHD